MRRITLVSAMCLLASCLDTSSAGTKEGYWKLEKVSAEPQKTIDTCAGRENDMRVKDRYKYHDKVMESGVVELKWTKLPDVLVPNRKNTVTVNAVLKRISSETQTWMQHIFFYPQYPKGDVCAASIAGKHEGIKSSSQGPKSCTYEYPSGAEHGKDRIEARIRTRCLDYIYTYIWYFGLPPVKSSAPTPPTPSPSTQGKPAQTWESIDAKKALDISVGLLTPDLKYDVDKNGSVDARDATLILQAVVTKR